MFFEDPTPIKELQTKYAIYAEHFPQWSEHTSAIHQYMRMFPNCPLHHWVSL